MHTVITRPLHESEYLFLSPTSQISVWELTGKLWLVTELCTGGDLSSRKLNEHDTKNVIEQVLRALVYLHRMGVVHRDIKLENILYENHSKNATIRLIDFGLSKTFDRTESLGDYARTPYTMAPEVAADPKSIVTDKMDVWAVGVITWILLSGEFPFIKTNSDLKDQEKMTKLKKVNFAEPTPSTIRNFLIIMPAHLTLNDVSLDRLIFTSVLLGKEEASRKKPRILFLDVFKGTPKNGGQRSKPWRICKNTGDLRLIRYGMIGRKR